MQFLYDKFLLWWKWKKVFYTLLQFSQWYKKQIKFFKNLFPYKNKENSTVYRYKKVFQKAFFHL